MTVAVCRRDNVQHDGGRQGPRDAERVRVRGRQEGGHRPVPREPQRRLRGQKRVRAFGESNAGYSARTPMLRRHRFFRPQLPVHQPYWPWLHQDVRQRRDVRQ